MSARLASSVLVGALVRQAEAEGGFAAVLAKGDPTAGSILLILLERGGNPQVLERILQPDGRYAWQASGSRAEAVPELVAQRRRFDPDLWVLELNVSEAERFTAQLRERD